jgi:hypothetical protein
MPFSVRNLLAFGAAFGLALAPLAAAPIQFLAVPMCGTHLETHYIPIPGKPNPPDCPSGCHAALCRKAELEDDSE